MRRWIVIAGAVGAGIFANPSEVAHRVHRPFLILGVWMLGGCSRCGVHCMLTAPRVYYAMARDGHFFSSVGKLFGKAEAPVVAIILQGFAAIVIACSGTYGEILKFRSHCRFHLFGMTAAALFILCRRRIGSDSVTYRVLGHPFTTMLFVLSCAAIVLSAMTASPRNSAIALCIMLAGLPLYYFWSRFRRAHSKFKTAQT